MKKTYKISIMSLLAMICTLGIFNSCTDQQEVLNLPYLFRPVNFSAAMNSTVVTISWAKVDSAASYTLEVSTDSVNYSNPVIQVTTTSTSYMKELAGNTKFWARLKANAADSLKNSKYNIMAFTTPKENIFLGYGTSINTNQLYSAYMTGFDSLDVKWRPNANVTHFILTATDGTRDSVAISPSELTNGEKLVGSLFNSNWKVEIYNGKILRGTTHGIIEGDILLKAGDNLATALASATSGQVILLAGNAVFPIGGGAYNFSKNVKIRSTSPTNRSVVCMTAGTPTITANMFGVVAGSAIDSLVFENIDFTGYCNNSTSSTKIGYLFSNKTACTVGNFKFNNCKIHNLGNTPFRLSGNTGTTLATSQRISNLVFNGCIINETGFASGYGIVNISKSSDYIDNITIANSTIYNFSYPVIAIAQSAATTMNSVTIQNCNFNQSTQNATAARVLFNFDFMNITNGITIKNCVFGSSGSMTAGLKATNSTNPIATTITGCYFTSDYIDETLIANTPYSIKSKMTPYSGASTALWNDPVNGDFKLKDTGFAGKGVAGDLRW